MTSRSARLPSGEVHEVPGTEATWLLVWVWIPALQAVSAPTASADADAATIQARRRDRPQRRERLAITGVPPRSTADGYSVVGRPWRLSQTRPGSPERHCPHPGTRPHPTRPGRIRDRGQRATGGRWP